MSKPISKNDPFLGRGEMTLFCDSCKNALSLGIINKDDAVDLDPILLARRINAENPAMIAEVGAWLDVHRDHDWLPCAIMPESRYKGIS